MPNLDNINIKLQDYTPNEIINWAYKTYGSGLFSLTSAGTDSALTIEHISKLKVSIPIIHIDTGFLPKETTEFKKKLKKMYDLNIIEFGPSNATIDEINKERLWEKDLQAYSKLTKLDPLTKAINELKVRALITGVRGDQTENRAKLKVVGIGNDGEIRIRPFINWSKDDVNEYFKIHNLPRNNLYSKGYESVGDLHVTKAGKGRDGREIIECGLHMVNGRLVRNKAIIQ